MPPQYVLVEDDNLTDLRRLQLSKFLNVAGLAAFVFDYCLTFPTEVKYVWGSEWGLTRIVFTLSRYLPFFASSLACYAALVDVKCGSFVLALDGIYTASIIFAEAILLLRTYALWGRSRRVLAFLLLLAAAFIAAAEVLSLRVSISLPKDSTSIYQFYPSFCAYGSSRAAAPQYLLLMGYEIILQSMNSWRKFRTYRNIPSRTLNTLYWDGIMYMWWIIALSAANSAAQIAAPVTYILAFDTFVPYLRPRHLRFLLCIILTSAQVAVHGLLAARIFFNLRRCDRERTFSDEVSLDTLRYRARSIVDVTTQAETVNIV